MQHAGLLSSSGGLFNGPIYDGVESGFRGISVAELQGSGRLRDSGGGIPPEHLGKLFEPFFTTKPIGKGTGLGLHVAYKIVKAHGGKIELTSKAGEGSEFVVFLPVMGPADRKD